MAMISASRRDGSIECGDDDQFAELEGGHGNRPPQGCEVVLVAAADLLEGAGGAQPLQAAREAPSGALRQVGPELAGLEAADGPLPPDQREEQGEVFAGEEIEPAVAGVPPPDAGGAPGLVVQLDRGRAHVVLDPRALDAGGEVVPRLPLVGGGQLAAQEGG